MNPKWDLKARVGIYLGHSPIHAGSVTLVLNQFTLHISLEFHVIFDDDFTTIPYLSSSDIPPTWSQLYKDSGELATEAQFELTTGWAANANLEASYLRCGWIKIEYNLEKCSYW